MVNTKVESEAIAPNPPPKQLQKPKGFRPFRRIEWIVSPATYLTRTKERTPDFFEEDSLGFGNGPTVIASHPTAIQYILSRDRKTFATPGEFNRILSPFIGTHSVIMLSGEAHKQRRQLMAPAFHGDRLSLYGDLICELTHELVGQAPQNQPFALRNLTQQISLQTIAKVVLGSPKGDRTTEMTRTLTKAVDTVGSPISAAMLFFDWLQKDLGKWSPWGRFIDNRNKIDELIYAEISDRRENPSDDRTDILSMLMASRTETGDGLSDQELRDELMSLLLAGHETTATAIAWAMYWIHREPRVKSILLAELDGLSPEATPADIAALPYLTAVCKETLRRSPVAMFTFPRVAQEPVDLLGYHFEAGSTFLGCIFLTHQREDLYPDPQAFRPERFLERKFSPYEFIPFGNGARRCVGEALAQYELKLAVATMVANYEFELASDKPEKPSRRGVTLAPANGVPILLKGKRG
ncbi:MAG: cytochrome P450 [Cyanobacteria bacterium J06614_10]